MTGEIMQQIATLTVAAEPPGEWDFLPRVHGLRRYRFGSDDLLESLGQQYSQEQLASARVLVPGEDGEWRPSSTLAGDDQRLLVLRTAKREYPFDIVNHHGSLVSDDPPAFQSCRDYITNAHRGSKIVLAACSDDDLAVLRMLGLPCTSASGLAHLNGSQVSRFFDRSQCFSESGRADAAIADVLRLDYQVILVAWHVAAVSDCPPDEIHDIVSRFFQVEEVFGFNTSKHIGIWRPNVSDFERIRSAIKFADRNLVSGVMWECSQRSVSTIREYAEYAGDYSARNDYCTARRELHRVLDQARERGFRNGKVSKSLAAVRQSFDASVVAKIIRDAMATANPVERSLLLMAADLMGDWHDSVDIVRNAERGLEGRPPGRGDPLEPEDLRSKLRVVDGLVKIHRELTRDR